MSVKSNTKRLARPITTRLLARVDIRIAQALSPLVRELEGMEARMTMLEASLATDIEALSRQVPTIVNQIFEARMTSLETDIEGLETGVEALNRYTPAVVNTIASQSASSRENRRLLKEIQAGLENHEQGFRYIQQRIEFIRKELLLELRYNDRDSRQQFDAVEPQIVNQEKLEQMRGHIRVNIGAGHIPLPEYLNVDARALPGIDVTSDVRKLPFSPGEVSEIYSAHLLEHFPAEELRRSILPHWVSLLEPGGTFVAVVPDTETMVTERAAGRMPFGDFIEVMYGGQDYDGDFHFSGFSPESLTALLVEAGLEDVKVRENARRNGACYEMEIEATRRTS